MEVDGIEAGLVELSTLDPPRVVPRPGGGLAVRDKVTLVLSLISDSWAIQVSDRRLVYLGPHGQVVRKEDERNKAVLWCNHEDLTPPSGGHSRRIR